MGKNHLEDPWDSFGLIILNIGLLLWKPHPYKTDPLSDTRWPSCSHDGGRQELAWVEPYSPTHEHMRLARLPIPMETQAFHLQGVDENAYSIGLL